MLKWFYVENWTDHLSIETVLFILHGFGQFNWEGRLKVPLEDILDCFIFFTVTYKMH